MIQSILNFFERQTFGVCDWWGNKLGISSYKIRIVFIYLSFITFGSPLIVYIVMAFFLENKEAIKGWRKKRRSIWEL